MLETKTIFSNYNKLYFLVLILSASFTQYALCTPKDRAAAHAARARASIARVRASAASSSATTYRNAALANDAADVCLAAFNIAHTTLRDAVIAANAADDANDTVISSSARARAFVDAGDYAAAVLAADNAVSAVVAINSAAATLARITAHAARAAIDADNAVTSVAGIHCNLIVSFGSHAIHSAVSIISNKAIFAINATYNAQIVAYATLAAAHPDNADAAFARATEAIDPVANYALYDAVAKVARTIPFVDVRPGDAAYNACIDAMQLLSDAAPVSDVAKLEE